MIAEAGTMAVLTLAGLGLLSWLPGPLPGPARVALAVPTGGGVYLVVALVMLTLGGSLDALTALAVALLPGLIGVGIALVRRPMETSRLLAVTIAAALVAVVITRVVHLTRLTPDSLRYLLAANDLVLPDGIREMNRADLLNRQVGLPALQALHHLSDRRYLASLAPAYGLSGLSFFAWLGWRMTQGLARRPRLLLVGGAVLFLGGSNRLVYDSFYINTHIQVATYLLVAVAGTWLAWRENCASWALPAGIGLAATLLLRPESPLVTAIFLVAIAVTPVARSVRALVVIPVLVVGWLWYGIILWNLASRGNVISLTSPVFGSLAALVLASLAVWGGSVARWQPLFRHFDKLLYLGLVGLLVFQGRDQIEVLTTSVEATAINLAYQGMWLLTWPVTLGLLAVAMLLPRPPGARLWTVPIAGFSLLYWLLPLLREGAYRIGVGDSGNRLVAHIFPVMVGFLLLMAVHGRLPHPPERG
ncbi:MAG TPA: hypothetical protein VJR05_05615 [Acidimicrobiia bacterium]|nr:hypothetical protein [Acidimicrobiia bacterium]